MRNLLTLLFAVCFFASFTLAQHTNTTTQTGNRNDSEIDQEFDGGGAFLPGNEAYVTQLGDDNISNVYQNNNGFAGTAQYAVVHSQGNANKVDVDQENDGFDAYATQIGNSNNAKIFQTGNKGLGTVYQQGNNNNALMNVWGTNSDAYILQDGNRNDARQNLGQGYGLKVEDSYLEAKQYGDDNVSRQDITGQGFAGGITSDNNNGYVYQNGNTNFAKQDIGLYNGNVMNNLGTINQTGNSNDGRQFMYGDGNTSTINQTGNQNQAVSLQN